MVPSAARVNVLRMGDIRLSQTARGDAKDLSLGGKWPDDGLGP